MVDTVEEFLQCAGVAEGERNAMVTVRLSAAVTWPDDVEKPSGQLRRGLQVRLCYYRAFSEGSPTLATKKTITPASVAAFKPSPQGTSASKPGWIVRFLLPWSYLSSGERDWQRIQRNPSCRSSLGMPLCESRYFAR